MCVCVCVCVLVGGGGGANQGSKGWGITCGIRILIFAKKIGIPRITNDVSPVSHSRGRGEERTRE